MSNFQLDDDTDDAAEVRDWYVLAEQKLTEKQLDAIARKNRPRIHHCSDTPKIVLSRRLREEAERVMREQALERGDPDIPHLQKMTRIRTNKRQQIITAISDYLSVISKDGAVTISDLAQLFNRTETTITEYVRILFEERRIYGYQTTDWFRKYYLWGKE
jgi:hypothetical protein